MIQEPYINFPVHMLKGITQRRNDTLSKILTYGIFNFALNDAGKYIVEPTEEDLKRTLEDFRDLIPPKYKSMPNLLYSIFSGEYTVNQLKKKQQNWHFFTVFNKICQTMVEMNLSPPPIETFKDAYYNFKQENKITSSKTKISAKVHSLINHQDSEVDNDELHQFLLYLSIRSTMGVRQYNTKPTYKSVIFARMFGYESFDAVPEKIKNQKPHKFYMDSKKYRYHQDKLLKETCRKWKLIKYANHTHGMYFALNIFGEKNLIHYVIRQKTKFYEKIKQKRIIQIEADALKQIKQENK
jgi:hypothetical protein